MAEAKLVFFVLGTLGFLTTVYLAIKHPDPAKGPQPSLEDGSADAMTEANDSVVWRKWNNVATWLMWGGWGIAGFLTFLMQFQDNTGGP